MITEIASSSGIRQLSIVTPTTIDGVFTELGRINTAGQYRQIAMEITNGHPTVALTDFELSVIAVPWAAAPIAVPIIAGGLWVPGIFPTRLVLGSPESLAAGATAVAIVEIIGWPALMLRASQTIDPVAAIVTVNVTLI